MEFGGVTGQINRYSRRSVDSEGLSSGYDSLRNERGEYTYIIPYCAISSSFSNLNTQTGNITDIFDTDSSTYLELYFTQTSCTWQYVFDSHIIREFKSFIFSFNAVCAAAFAATDVIIKLEVSKDGTTWEELDNYTANMAAGASVYIDLLGGSLRTRYIKISGTKSNAGVDGTARLNLYIFNLSAYT